MFNCDQMAPFGLLHLPAEISLKIYTLYAQDITFCAGDCGDLRFSVQEQDIGNCSFTRITLGLLLSSRAVRAEVLTHLATTRSLLIPQNRCYSHIIRTH